MASLPISLRVLLRGQLRLLSGKGFHVTAVSSSEPNEVDMLLRQEGDIKFYGLPITRTISPFTDLYTLIRLVIFFAKHKPDIVHTHTPKAGLLGMMAAWICSVPVRMHTVAGLPLTEATGLKRFILRWTERITYACAHRVYPNSKHLHTYILSEFKVWGSKFKVIGNGSSNGIDTDFFLRNNELIQQARTIRHQYNIPEEAVVFSFAGRMVKDKGVKELVHAFKKLNVAFPVKLLLIGPYEEHDPLSPEVLAEIGNNNDIIAAGFQQDVRPWIMASDVFVFPSYREGFPNVVMQAACLEVPCIVSDINGCNEIIRHNETGLIVPVKDSDALHQSMTVLANDKEKRASFSRTSRAFVVQNFDQQYVWNMLLQEYESLLRKHVSL